MMDRFTSLSGISRDTISDLLELAGELETDTPPDALHRKVLGLVFFNSSIRTLASFQSAMSRLGGSSFVVSPGQGSWDLEWREGEIMDGDKAEHVRDAIPVLCSYADALGVRIFGGPENITETFGDRAFEAIDAACNKPLINLESAVDHPCQALADWKTLDDYEVPDDGKFVLSWARHPKALPLAVPAAAASMAAQRGMEVVVLRPESHALPTSLAGKVNHLAQQSGGTFVETSDLAAAHADANVVYAKSWGPTSDGAHEIKLDQWTISETTFQSTDPSCRFMHCLPVRRGVVVTDEVIESERSVVQRQAANRMYAQMAVLFNMLTQESQKMSTKEIGQHV